MIFSIILLLFFVHFICAGSSLQRNLPVFRIPLHSQKPDHLALTFDPLVSLQLIKTSIQACPG